MGLWVSPLLRAKRYGAVGCGLDLYSSHEAPHVWEPALDAAGNDAADKLGKPVNFSLDN